MRREDLAKELMENNPGIFRSKDEADKVVKALFQSVAAAVANGVTVNIGGFGSFTAKERAARDARNPRTGEVIRIPAKRVPVFTPVKAFKDSVK